MSLRLLGQVALVQVAPRTVKVAGQPEGYDPAPLTVVDQLLVNWRGAVGLAADGSWLIDVHNADHPQTRNRGGKNTLALGFTSHYAAMRARFGAHMVVGCAGENVIIAADALVTLPDLGAALVIHHQETDQLFHLRQMQVAEPCVSFARYAVGPSLAASKTEMKAALQFLRAGMRGFYLAPAPGTLVTVRAGDGVYALAEEANVTMQGAGLVTGHW